MGIGIPDKARIDIGREARNCAERAVKDYRQPGSHSVGYEQSRIPITDGAVVEVIVVCYSPDRLKRLKCDVIEQVHKLLSDES
jgi:DNA invertase Pin-like site-specific DNA recombinase